MTKIMGRSRCKSPASVAVDSHGDVFVGCYAQNVVFEVTPQGKTTSTSWHSPIGVAADDNGNLYVIEERSGVFERQADGTIVQVAAPFEFDNPEGLAVRYGALYVGSFGGEALYKATP